jgi:hypothetical protein
MTPLTLHERHSHLLSPKKTSIFNRRALEHHQPICQELVPRGTCPAYFRLLVPRVQATVSHNDKED